MTDPIRVLHVDDEPDFAEMTAEFIEREDDRLSVETATSASEGLERLAGDDLECIVSDYEMPGRNGIEFLEAVREAYPDLPFILFTGKGSEEVASEAISKGVTDYLQKEHGTDQYAILANRILNSVERTHAHREREAMRERMELALEYTDSVIFEIDLDTGAVRRLGDFERFFEVPPDEVPTWEDHLDHAVHPADREEFRDLYQRLVEGELESGVLEYRTTSDGGGVRWIRDDIYVRDDEPRQAIGLARDITRRKEREQERQRKERRYQAVFNDPNILVGLLDVDGTVLDINETAMEYIDAELADIIDEPFWETPWFTGDETIQEEVRQWVEQAATGEYVEFEVDLSETVNDQLVISGVFRPVTDDEDEVVSLLISDRDVTEWKGREQAIEELHSTARAFMEAETDEEIADIAVEAVRDILDMPANGLHLYDESEGGLVPAAWTARTEELVGEPPTFAAGEGLAGTAFQTGEPRIYDDISAVPERFNPDTSVRSQIIYPLDEHGVLVIGSAEPDAFDDTDISLAGTLAAHTTAALDRVAREQALVRGQELFRAIMETSIDGILVMDENREYVTWNQQFLDMWDVPEELIGDKPEEEGLTYALDLLEDPDEFIRKVEYLYEHPSEESRDQVNLVDGRVFDRYSAPVEGEDGTYFGRVWFFRDVTDRVDAVRELEEKNRRLEEFASILSHDLRNPLNVAEGRLRLVQGTYDDDNLDAIERALDRMEALIEDMLRLAREGAAVEETEAVDLGDLIEACWQTVETADARLTVETELRIQAEESRLRQLLENVIRNAIEHGGSGVTVTIGDLDDRSGFFVEDTGPGIPAEDRDRVFESGVSTSETGTGFGLAIVERIAHAHGWSIAVTESHTGGARFEFSEVDVGE